MEAPTPNKFPKKIIDFKCDEKKYGLTLSCETNLKICIIPLTCLRNRLLNNSAETYFLSQSH